MFVLGITGGIGSGKSTVSGILAERGLLVLDADEISRAVTGPAGRAMPEIAETFGKKVVTSTGALNRRVMSDIAFGDKKKLDDIADGEKPWKSVIGDFYSTFEPMVSDTMSRKDEHKVGERVLGVDPESGKPVSVKIGRFGPIVQIGSAEDEEKPRFAQMRKGQTLETITLEEAMELFRLPRTLGEFEGSNVVIGTGRFGPYIHHSNMYVSLQGKVDPMEITLEQAVAMLTDKRENESRKVIKTFTGESEMEILNGRYGPYISYNGSNYKIPKSKVPAELTLEECNEIIKAQIDKTGSAPRRRIFKAKK